MSADFVCECFKTDCVGFVLFPHFLSVLVLGLQNILLLKMKFVANSWLLRGSGPLELRRGDPP